MIGKDPSARIHEIRDLLSRNSIPFGFLPSDSEDGRAALERLGVAGATGPVVALYTGAVLVDPANAEVAEALGNSVRPAGLTYDVVIVGAGPAGLAAAVYGSSEGLRTALLEREAFGGQAGTSSRIRNYLGFPRGISGAELAARATEQARVFGAHFVYGNPATSLAEGGDLRVVGLEDGSQIRARAVIIATGVAYRRLAVPGLEVAHRRRRLLRGRHGRGPGGGREVGVRGRRRELGRAGRPAPVEICAPGHHRGPLGVPRREHVRLPDPRDRERAQHLCPLPHRVCGRRRCRAP